MNSKYFEDLKETIEDGCANDMPRDARLILVGRILHAALRNEITYDERVELEEMLGRPAEWAHGVEFALFGHEENDEAPAAAPRS